MKRDFTREKGSGGGMTIPAGRPTSATISTGGEGEEDHPQVNAVESRGEGGVPWLGGEVAVISSSQAMGPRR